MTLDARVKGFRKKSFGLSVNELIFVVEQEASACSIGTVPCSDTPLETVAAVRASVSFLFNEPREEGK